MTPVEGQIEVLPIRHVAARFIAKVERDGIDELDTLTSNTFKHIRPTYLAWLFVVGIGAALTLTAIVASLVVAVAGQSDSNAPAVVTGILAFGWIAALETWRWFQYGFGWLRTPLPAIYVSADSALTKNIDRFFGAMQRDTKLRAFYNTRSGAKRFVNRQHFFGRLRVLMLSEHDWIRKPVFSPTGLWFARELFIEADVAALIAQAQAKPKAGGRPKDFDYAAIALTLIERSELRDIRPGERGAEARIMTLIRDVTDGHPTGVTVPEVTQLPEFAKQILAAIEKNRTTGK